MKIIHKPELDEYTNGQCEECRAEINIAIEIGVAGEGAWVCLDCLHKAVEMLENQDGVE